MEGHILQWMDKAEVKGSEDVISSSIVMAWGSLEYSSWCGSGSFPMHEVESSIGGSFLSVFCDCGGSTFCYI